MKEAAAKIQNVMQQHNVILKEELAQKLRNTVHTAAAGAGVDEGGVGHDRGLEAALLHHAKPALGLRVVDLQDRKSVV